MTNWGKGFKGSLISLEAACKSKYLLVVVNHFDWTILPRGRFVKPEEKSQDESQHDTFQIDTFDQYPSAQIEINDAGATN